VRAGLSKRGITHLADGERNRSDIPRRALDATAAPLASGRALVVDDEAGIRRFARLLLTEAGFEVELAADGEAGLARLTNGAGGCALVLLDLTMPGPSGIDVLAEIRRRRIAVPVVLMSGYTEYEIATVLESDPHAHFLQKPFTAESLEEVLRSALAGETAAID